MDSPKLPLMRAIETKHLVSSELRAAGAQGFNCTEPPASLHAPSLAPRPYSNAHVSVGLHLMGKCSVSQRVTL